MLRKTTIHFIWQAGLGVLLIVTLGAAVWFDNAAFRGIVSRSPIPTPFPYSDGPALGVNVFNLHLEPDPAAVDRTFELARELGARYVRMQVPWEDIEIHGRGDFTDRRNETTIGVVSSWAKYDRIVASAVAHNIELIMRVDRTPAWACERGCTTPEFRAGLAVDGNSTGPPDDLADYGRFLATLVRRYRGQVRFFQVWNEPNLKNEWGWQDPKPADFLALLRVGYEAVKSANPDAIVLFPGLAPTDGLDPRAPMTELEYLDAIYTLGGAAYFDIMAAQNYGLGQPPTEHRYIFLRGRDNWNWRHPIDTRNDVSRVVLLREVMERHGDLATPVWVTEFGYNAAPDDIPLERRFIWGPPVDEETKGRYLVAQIERARREWPWMGVMSVWMLRYGGYADPDPADPTPYFALVSRDWQLMPSYQIVQEYLRAPAVAHVGVHTWDHPAVERTSSGWRLRFVGTGIELHGGKLTNVVIDGQETLMNGQAIHGLADTLHTIEMNGETPPTGFAIIRDLPWRTLGDYGPLILVAALAVMGALTMRTTLQILDHLLRHWRQIADERREWIVFALQGFTLAIAYRASAQLPITILGFLPFLGLSIARPDLALRWVAITVPLYLLPKGIFDARFGIRDSGIYLPLHEVVLWTTTIATILRDWRQLHWPGFMVLRTTIWALLPAGLVLLGGFWGVLIAEVRGPALRELRWMIIEPLLFIGLLWWHERQGRAVFYPVLLGWLAGGAVSALVALAQFGGMDLTALIGTKISHGADLVATEGVVRATGLYGHPNNLGLAMGRVWPLAVALAWGAWQQRRRWSTIILAGIAVLSFAALMASFSRGAYLGVLIAGGYLLFFIASPQLRSRVLIGTGFGIILAAVMFTVLGVERLSLLTGSSTIRLATWRAALAILIDHPFGIGLDQFLIVYQRYIDPTLLNTNEIYTAHPHNLVLDLLLRGGPLLFIGLGWAGWRILCAPVRSPSPLTIGAAATLAGALMHGLVDAFYFWPDLAFSFWLLVVCSANWRGGWGNANSSFSAKQE